MIVLRKISNIEFVVVDVDLVDQELSSRLIDNQVSGPGNRTENVVAIIVLVILAVSFYLAYPYANQKTLAKYLLVITPAICAFAVYKYTNRRQFIGRARGDRLHVQIHFRDPVTGKRMSIADDGNVAVFQVDMISQKKHAFGLVAGSWGVLARICCSEEEAIKMAKKLSGDRKILRLIATVATEANKCDV
jgi:hypothetical protein